MLHDKATISQSLARGFDLCGRREGGAAGCSAGKRWSRATGPSSALSGLDSRPCGFLHGFQTLLGILLLEAERACGERQAPASRSSEPRLWGLWVPCCSLTTAELPPPGASVRSGSNSQQAAIRGAGRRQNFPCLCVGSWAGVSVVEFRLFVVVLTQDLEAPSLISAFLQRL